jgi:hypothetical protein
MALVSLADGHPGRYGLGPARGAGAPSLVTHHTVLVGGLAIRKNNDPMPHVTARIVKPMR